MRKRIAVFTIVLSCLFFLTALITSLLQKSPLFFAIAIQFAAIGIISSHFLFHAQWRQDLISAIQAGRGESAKQMNLLKEQFDALLNIFFVLRPEKPLPTMSRWAAEPDFIKLLIHLLLKEKPKNIVEAGSGVSTLCMALAIHRYKLSSSILSLEHDQRCFDQTMNSLLEHGISDHVNLVYAPLKKYELKGKNMLWYETKGLQQISDIDMLVIDGPPAIQDPPSADSGSISPILSSRFNLCSPIF